MLSKLKLLFTYGPELEEVLRERHAKAVKEQAEIDRKKRMHDLAREQVQQRQEELKNMPSLRE